MVEKRLKSLRIEGLPRALRILRERRGLRQEDLVAILRAQYEISTHTTTLSKYETGAMSPGFYVVVAILGSLGYGLSDLEELLSPLEKPDRDSEEAPSLEEQAALLEDLLRVCHRMSARLASAVADAERLRNQEDSK